MFKLDIEKEEKKHKRTLSHYLEKIHHATGYQNKEVAEKLGLDKSYYSKVRLQQIDPLTTSIATLKRYASLNKMNIIDFIAEIEEIPIEIKEKDWVRVLVNAMNTVGPILRRELIHKRINAILENTEEDCMETLLKSFLNLCLMFDLLKYPKWFSLCSDFIMQIHQNLELEESKDLNNLIARIKKL
jgi:transcriptional regulator with XRE-family HTH domain